MKNVIIVLITIVYFVILGFSINNVNYKPLFSLILYLIFVTSIVFMKYKKWNHKLAIITIICIFCILIFVNVIRDSQFTFQLIHLISPITFIVLYSLSLLFYNKKKERIFFGLLIIMFTSFIAFIFTLAFNNKTNFDTFLGEYDFLIQNEMILKDAKGKIFKLDPGKIYVIDCWNKTCGVCFQKFPKFDKLKNKFSDNKNIEFIGLNFYKEEVDVSYSQDLFDSRNLNFNTYYIQVKEGKELPVYFFPTVLVIKNNKVIFRGHLETLDTYSPLYLK